jgi:hypothetical protein
MNHPPLLTFNYGWDTLSSAYECVSIGFPRTHCD